MRATAWPTQASASDPAPVGLERRLLLSYLVAFAVIFFVAGLAVRVAFVTSLERQTTTRLEILARAGLRTAIFRSDRLDVDMGDISNTATLMARGQGLQWFDSHGRLIAEQGLAPESTTLDTLGRQELSVGHVSLDAATLPIVNPRTHQVVGTVRASESNDDAQAEIHRLDVGLMIGMILGLAASGLGGLTLSHQAMRPVVRSFRTLREFVADASHELRSPLTAIKSNADVALWDERDAQRDRTRFEAISDAAQDMTKLTSDLLLLARADRSLERELFAIDLAAVVAKLAARYEPLFEEAGVTLETGELGGPTIYGDTAQVERILANLIDNALRYTARGGSVSIEVARQRANAVVRVRDTGIGIAPEHLDRVFDRFWRAESARSTTGTGLGLAIARALARRHGGDVTVASRLGPGSEFAVSFPVRPPAESARLDFSLTFVRYIRFATGGGRRRRLPP